MPKVYYIFISLLIIFLNSCSRRNIFDVDYSNVDTKIVYTNLDSLIMKTNLHELKSNIEKKGLKDGETIDYLLGYCLKVGQLNDTATLSSLNIYKNDQYVTQLHQEIYNNLYQKVPAYSQEINDAFARLKVLLPYFGLPKNVIYINSMFNSSAFATEHEISVGLERYLGPNSSSIKRLPSDYVYQWEKDAMLSQFLVRDAIVCWLYTHLLEDNNNPMLAEELIRWGKVLYITNGLLENKPIENTLRYSSVNYSWALKNEETFWKYLTKEKLLFSRNTKVINNLFNDAPFTIGFDESAPDRMGQFLGFQIVTNFMQKNKSISLDQLIKLPYTSIIKDYNI